MSAIRSIEFNTSPRNFEWQSKENVKRTSLDLTGSLTKRVRDKNATLWEGMTPRGSSHNTQKQLRTPSPALLKDLHQGQRVLNPNFPVHETGTPRSKKSVPEWPYLRNYTNLQERINASAVNNKLVYKS
jgi:hypothetical protein